MELEVTDNNAVDSIDEAMKDIEAKILHTLEIFPYISRGMVQQGIGPGVSPKLWDPVLERLCEEGKIKMVTTTVGSPSGRALSKTIYHLPKFPYPPVSVDTLEAETEAEAA